MNAAGLILLIPDKPDEERDALAAVWEHSGGEVIRLARFWDPPPLDTQRVRVYGSTSFVLVLREKLGLELCTPADDLILTLPPETLKRRIQQQILDSAQHFPYPLFVKPVVPKLFAARVYADLVELRRESEGLPADTAVFTADAVSFSAEARTFILNGEVLDCALYEGEGDIKDATSAASHFARLPGLPRTLVMDVGWIKDQGWVVIELNATWGSGLNGCQPQRVWPCIAAASGRSS